MPLSSGTVVSMPSMMTVEPHVCPYDFELDRLADAAAADVDRLRLYPGCLRAEADKAVAARGRQLEASPS